MSNNYIPVYSGYNVPGGGQLERRNVGTSTELFQPMVSPMPNYMTNTGQVMSSSGQMVPAVQLMPASVPGISVPGISGSPPSYSQGGFAQGFQNFGHGTKSAFLAPGRLLNKIGSHALATWCTNAIRYLSIFQMLLTIGIYVWFWILINVHDSYPMVPQIWLEPGLWASFGAALNFISILMHKKWHYVFATTAAIMSDLGVLSIIFFYYIEVDYLTNVCSNPDPTTIQPLFCTGDIVKGTGILSLLMQVLAVFALVPILIASSTNMFILFFYGHKGVITYTKDIAFDEAMKIDEEMGKKGAISETF